MAKSKEHSFDISAKLDMQEMKNAIVQAQKEVDNRYDFKGLTKEIDLNMGAKVLTLLSDSDNKVDAMKDILISKMNKRGVSINSLEELKSEDASGNKRKFSYKIVDTIEADEAKIIQKEIKGLKLKVTAANQGEEIRVSGKNLDDLQKVMKHLKSLEDLKAPLVFDNFR
ncbi:MAG: YajQ family cyclic di-GMP-binding protein [Campylobacterota bacterium]|nr:YajQ family cyclic di-GMP-binding protein [Campylobacterota bacterium]